MHTYFSQWSGRSKNQVGVLRQKLARKGYDTGKKVSGIKRNIAVDTQQGLPHAALTSSHVKALQALQRHAVQRLLADSSDVSKPLLKACVRSWVDICRYRSPSAAS